jgi:hypothetical protein
METAATATVVPTRVASRGVRTLPIPNPAMDAVAPLRTAAMKRMPRKSSVEFPLCHPQPSGEGSVSRPSGSSESDHDHAASSYYHRGL